MSPSVKKKRHIAAFLHVFFILLAFYYHSVGVIVT